MPIQSNPYTSVYFNPFRDVSKNPQAEFRKNYGSAMENHEGLRSERAVRVSGSEVSCETYNKIMEGDSLHFVTENSSGFLNARSLQISVVGDGESSQLAAKEGFLGTPIGAERSHIHAVLEDGDNSVHFRGNSQRNISLIEVGSGHKDVALGLGGGDDKTVLYLNGNATGVILIDGESGANHLEIHSKSPDISYQLADLKNGSFTATPDKLSIITKDVQLIEQYIAGERA